MSTIEILVLYPKCIKYSLELSKLTQIIAIKKHFFSSTRWRQKPVLCLHSCTDSLPTQRDRKKCFSGACLWVNFPDSKEFLHHFIQRTYFYIYDRVAFLSFSIVITHINAKLYSISYSSCPLTNFGWSWHSYSPSVYVGGPYSSWAHLFFSRFDSMHLFMNFYFLKFLSANWFPFVCK